MSTCSDDSSPASYGTPPTLENAWAGRLRKRMRISYSDNLRASDAVKRNVSIKRTKRVSPMAIEVGVAEPPAPVSRASPPEPPPPPLHINELPADVLLCVLGHVNVRDRIRARAVCVRWCELCELSLRSVRHVNLGHWFGPLVVRCRPVLTDQRFKKVLSYLPNLTKLELDAAGARLSRTGILSIGQLCPRLVDLDISCLRMSFRALESLCRNCPRLQRIGVPQLNFREQNLEVLLKYLGDLRVLELYSTAGVTGDCFSLLPASIRTVTLRSCTRIREHNFCRIGDRCPQLEHLCLSRTRVTTYDLQHIGSRCPNLRHLDVSGCNLVHLEHCLDSMSALTSLAAGAYANLNLCTFSALTQHCARLEKLDVRGGASRGRVTAAGLRLLARLPQLRWLDLSYQGDVTDEVLAELAKCPRLATLLLKVNYNGRSAFSERGLRDLVLECRSLSSLDVSCVRAVTRQLWDWLQEALPAERRLQLEVAGTDLEMLPPAAAAAAAPRLTLRCRGARADCLALLRLPEPAWSDDSDSDALDEDDLFPDVFIDWLWINNALWLG